ncbi:transglutaminase [Bordetella genomosp. 13]|uniref:transglutaminase n=1 Tax=Bordetella genomosp. 13 TaxID=463040 RepID=UPI0011AA331C|nr:transglutaminase [Bordetella genomosp. 13]
MSIPLYPAMRAGWAVLLCLACWSGAAGALELNPDRLRHTAESRYGPQAVQAVADWLLQLHNDAALPERDKIDRVNDFWNRSLLPAESIARPAMDWATPLEILARGRGAYADYAIGKYFSLAVLGVPVDRLRFIYVEARPEGGRPLPHMVLGYYPTPSAEPLVLDNLAQAVLPATQRPDLIPVFSFSAGGVYLDDGRAAPADRVGRWRALLLRMRREGLEP